MAGDEITPILIYTIRFLWARYMIELLGFILLILGAMLVVLHYLDNVEDIERKELQKLIGECVD